MGLLNFSFSTFLSWKLSSFVFVLSCFVINVFKAVKFSQRSDLVVPYIFWHTALLFCSVKYFILSPLIFSLTKGLFNSMLFSFQAYGIFKNYPFVMKSSLYSIIVIVCAMLVLGNLLRLLLSLKFNADFCEYSMCSWKACTVYIY